MLLDEYETLTVLQNKYIYTVPNVSVFGDLYNLVRLEPFSEELIEQFRQEDLLPKVGLKRIVDNVIARQSADIFTKIIRDGKFYVESEIQYNELNDFIQTAISELKENDATIFAEMMDNDSEIPTNYRDDDFIAAVNDDPNAYSYVQDIDFSTEE
jgi:hypothetical protein